LLIPKNFTVGNPLILYFWPTEESLDISTAPILIIPFNYFAALAYSGAKLTQWGQVGE